MRPTGAFPGAAAWAGGADRGASDVLRSLPGAESIISGFNDEIVEMIIDGSYHNHLGLHWIQADVDGDGRTEYVPHGDRTDSRPPEESYLLFTPPSPSPTLEVSTTRRFYFGGNVYDGWSSATASRRSMVSP